MKGTSLDQMQVIEATKSALLSHNADTQDFEEIQSKFSDLLKNNFEDRNIWLRFGLTILLSKSSPQSALQAFNECMRIDQNDPLPAMLAAKLLLENLDEPEKALDIVDESIKRCKRLIDSGNDSNAPVASLVSDGDKSATKAKSSEDLCSNRDSITISTNSSSSTSQSSISPDSQQQPTDKVHQIRATSKLPSNHPKNINPLLSRSYLLASVTHAHIYEREPESIKQFKTHHLEESLRFLDLALEMNPLDHLGYFHKSLHQVKQRTYPAAIDNLRRAIQISPHHIRSMQLLILTLSALKLNDEALVLCEATLHEFEDNLLLLYFKCNLEQRLVGTKGYKAALCTAQHMLKCLQRLNNTRDSNNISDTNTNNSSISNSNNNNNNNNNNGNKNYSSTTTISVAAQSIQNQVNQQHQPASSQQNGLNQQQQQPRQQQSQQAGQSQQQQQNPSSSAVTNSTNGHNNAAVTVSTNTTPVLSPLSKPSGDSKQMNNLFADDSLESTKVKSDILVGELSLWLIVAEIFVKIGSIEDAELCVDEASIHASGALSHKVMFVRGLIAKARNNLIEAKTFFQSCLALCPRHAMALQQVAHVYYLLGNHATAEKFLKDSLDLDADCFKTWHYLSLVLIELNQHDRASECAKKSTLLEESAPVVPFSVIPRLILQ